LRSVSSAKAGPASGSSSASAPSSSSSAAPKAFVGLLPNALGAVLADAKLDNGFELGVLTKLPRKPPPYAAPSNAAGAPPNTEVAGTEANGEAEEVNDAKLLAGTGGFA